MRELRSMELCFVSGGSPFCGPQGSWASNFIPDEVFGVDFGWACDLHDQGYTQGLRPRAELDSLFLDRMLGAASGNPLATVVAYVYYGFVSVFGGAFYGPANSGQQVSAEDAASLACDAVAEFVGNGLDDAFSNEMSSQGIDNAFEAAMMDVFENRGGRVDPDGPIHHPMWQPV